MSTTIDYRAPTDDERRALFTSDLLAFGASTAQSQVDEAIARKRPLLSEWYLAAFDGALPAAMMAVVPVMMHWGGNQIAATGVTDVATLPSHRRRGLLTGMMTRAYARMREQGRAVAILEASMAAIYQRFGWAIGYEHRIHSFDPRHLRFVDDLPVTGRVRLVASDQARPLIEDAYHHYAAPRTLPLVRGDKEWRWALNPERPADPPFLVAVYQEGGRVLGYIVYTIGVYPERRPGPDQRITVRELVWLTPAAHRALMQFVLGYDLVDQIVIYSANDDDPLFHHVQEPRLLNIRASDGALVRIIDLVAAIEQRQYAAAGRLTLAIEDRHCPWNSGVWQITVEHGTARALPATAEAQLRLDPRALALLLTGRQRATWLARTGLLQAADRQSLLTADALFATALPPLCLDHWM